MNQALRQLERMRLAMLPTPLVAAPCLAEVLGVSRLYVKRDDLTGFASGGNKARPPAQAAHAVLEIAQECLRLLTGPDGRLAAGIGPAATSPGATALEVTAADVVVTDARGLGHGLPSPEGMTAAELAMGTEGLMVDPVYTAKALAVVGTPDLAGAETVVFWHTGGVLDVVALAEEAVAEEAGR